MSAQIFLVRSGGQLVVGRIPGEYLASMVPNVAEYEASTLQALQISGFGTPRVLCLHEDVMLLSHISGLATADASLMPNYYEQFAHCLAAIHASDTAGFEHLLPMRLPYQPRPEPWRTDLPEAELVAALAQLPEPSLEPRVLRHGDFWPGNVLWADGQISGVIDWENALLGPAIADLAISQLDMWWIGGEPAMRAFTDAYLQSHPIALDDLRYWQIRAALRPMANVEEWAAPYASLGRADITATSVVNGLREFLVTGCGLSFSSFRGEDRGRCQSE